MSLTLSCRPAAVRGPDTPGVTLAGSAQSTQDDVELVAIEVLTQLDREGRKTVTRRVSSRVMTARGVELTSGVGVQWSPWFQEKPEVRAWVTPAGGARTPLDPRTLSEGPAARGDGVYSDARILEAPLPNVAVGALVESETVRRETRPFYAGPRHFGWWPAVGPTAATQRFVVEAPEDVDLVYFARGTTLTPAVETIAGVRRWTFAITGGLPETTDEPSLPPTETSYPSVVFSTGRSWQAVAEAYHRTVRAAVSPAEVSALAREAAGRETDLRKKTARILARLRERVRYEAVELGEASIVPRHPKETLARGYGDCKDLAVLLVSALEAVGVEASVALLRVGSNPDVDQDAPGLEAFDHAIVYVPAADLWVDATYDLERPGQLPLSSQNRRALVADPDTTALRTTWTSQSKDNVYREVREVFLGSGRASRVVERSSATGALDDDLSLGHVTGGPEGDLREGLSSYALDQYGTSTITQVKRGPRSAPFTMELEVHEPTVSSLTEDDAAVALRPRFILGWMPDWIAGDGKKREPRRSPMELRMPYRAEVEYRIHAPWGYQLREPPPPIDKAMGPARLVRDWRMEGDVLVVRHTFDAGPRRYSAADVEAYRSALDAVAGELDHTVAFDEQSEALVSAGRIGEALAHGREAVRRAPESAVARSQYAKHLLGAGMGDAARAEARRGVELAPTDALAYFRLGWVLQHDRWGRMSGPGWDVVGARAAYRRAIELNDRYPSFHQNLALVDQHDERGVAFGAGAPLEQSIERYRHLDEVLEAEGYDEPLARVLFRAGRYADADKVIQAAPRSAELAPVALANTAALSGVEPMRKLAAAWGLKAEGRAEAFRVASLLLMTARLYPMSAEAMNEAAVGSPNAVMLRASASSMANVQRSEVKLPTLSPPIRVTLAWAEGAVRMLYGYPVDRRVYSRAALAELPAQVTGGASAMSRTFTDAGLTPENMMDTLTSLARFEVSGDAAGGYRVAYDAPPSQHAEVFLVSEGGELKFRGADRLAVASEAWSRLDRKDLAGAQRWFDWTSKFPKDWRSPVLCGADTRADAARMRACLASMLIGTPNPDRDLAGALRAVRGQILAEHQNDIDSGIAFALLGQKRAAEAEPISAALIEKRPTASGYRQLRLRVLARLGRFAEAKKLWTTWLAEPEPDRGLRGLAISVAAQSGDFAEAVALASAQVGAESDSTALNNRAWYRVCAGDATTAEAEAVQAAQANQFRSPALLHTLATAQAELGKPEAAMASLRRALDLRAGPAIALDDYVWARIAESYGLRDEARVVYERFAADTRGEDGDGVCAAHLSRRALERLRKLK